ncbi:hypothetical protein L9F63_007457, partial [Diploptera punctata]
PTRSALCLESIQNHIVGGKILYEQKLILETIQCRQLSESMTDVRAECRLLSESMTDITAEMVIIGANYTVAEKECSLLINCTKEYIGKLILETIQNYTVGGEMFCGQNKLYSRKKNLIIADHRCRQLSESMTDKLYKTIHMADKVDHNVPKLINHIVGGNLYGHKFYHMCRQNYTVGGKMSGQKETIQNYTKPYSRLKNVVWTLSESMTDKLYSAANYLKAKVIIETIQLKPNSRLKNVVWTVLSLFINYTKLYIRNYTAGETIQICTVVGKMSCGQKETI